MRSLRTLPTIFNCFKYSTYVVVKPDGVSWSAYCKMDFFVIHLTYLVRGDVKRDVVSKKYRDTLRKRIEAVVDTILPLYGNGFTQAHWKWCACIRITAILRTA